MSFANTSYSDIIATTIENRRSDFSDNVTKHNAILVQLKKKGRIEEWDGGGYQLIEPLIFAQNSNGGWYSGYDLLPVAAQDVISAAQYAIKQYAVPITISGLEKIQNSGKEAILSLIEGRMKAARATMANDMAEGMYSDGTGAGGKQITGLGASITTDPTTGTYGGISRVNWTFWRHYYKSGTTATKDNIQDLMNTAWVNLLRGADRPDLIVAGKDMWGYYMSSLQALQRFTGVDTAKLGFPSILYMDADVVADGGIGGNANTKYMYFLNTDYLKYRPIAGRNMVPLSPEKRYAVNQDAEVVMLGWAGNMTSSGQQFQGLINGN